MRLTVCSVMALAPGLSLGALPAPVFAAGHTVAPGQAPVEITSQTPTVTAEPGDPWWPGMVTLGTTAVLALTLPPAIPLGWASGHVLGGDPWRGLGLAYGGVGVVALGTLVGGAAVHASGYTRNAQEYAFLFDAAIGAGVTAVGYTGFMAWDASSTAGRLQRQRLRGAVSDQPASPP